MAAGPWWGRGLVVIEPAEEPEPALLAGAKVPEDRRHCTSCGRRVGQGRDRGQCGHCRTVFDFEPRLRPGDLVDDRYRVRGVLSHGGFGWAYLADDTRLSRRVVIKGVIDDRVAETLAKEAARLADLDNPYIVRIWEFISEGHYLVLDYAGGSTVRPVTTAEPLESVLAFGLQLLEALDYLHGRGYLHCDVKPGNIVRSGDRVRLIDFGAVRRIDDPTPIGSYTELYCPPAGDRERARPTVLFDLYCAAATLAELCHAHLEFHAGQPGVQALRLLLSRALHNEPERRFASARQFAEQLSGVIQQVIGAQAVPHRSVVFAPMTDALDGGLGEVPPAERWADGGVTETGIVRMAGEPFTCPRAEQVSGALPVLLPDPWEPTGVARPLPAADWRTDWRRGVASLAAGDAGQAATSFELVRAAVPGELVPMLVLGLCAELQGRDLAALGCYEIVAAVDQSLSAAHFGRARLLLTYGRRTDAVDALDRVPRESRFDRAARIARVRSLTMVLTTVGGTLAPTPTEVKRARDLGEELNLDKDPRAVLEVEFAGAEAAFEIMDGTLSNATRQRLEAALRGLAAFARSEQAHTALTDLANAVRPATIWSWLCTCSGGWS
jgi:serine/threonine-protein kinase PknG